MDNVVTRKYEVGDATAVASLLNAIAERAGLEPWAVPAAVESYVASSVRNLALDSRLVLTADGTLAAVGMVPTPAEGTSRVSLFGGVHPRWRGRGLGRELLDWQLTRAAIHAAEAPGAGWHVRATAPAPDEDTARLFRRKGLAPSRYWLTMVAPTVPPPAAAPPPDGLRVISYEPAYEQAVHATHMEAFADTWGFQYQELADWVPMSVRSRTFLPELSRIALDEDEVAGYVLCQRGTDPAQFYVDDVGVRAPWRRRGVASRLLADVLRAAGEAGMARARLMVDTDSPTGAVGVYQRAGFTVESRAVTYTAPLSAAG